MNRHLQSKVPMQALLKIGLFANAFEWYEFAIFNALAGVFGKLFFSSSLPVIELLKALSFVALSYFIRPLGSIVLGLLGDKKGRRYALQWSLMLMAIPTILIGLLPTYHQIGISATLILFVLRLIQGFAMGGELPITACYIFEASSPQSRSLLCGVVGAAPKIGLLLGSMTVYCIMSYFDEQTVLDWAWRIPFWLSIPLSLFIVYIRNSIDETGDIAKVKPDVKLIDRLRSIKAPLVQGLCICVFLNVAYPTLTLWLPFYLHHFLDVPFNLANLARVLSLCIMVPLVIGSAYLAGFLGYRKLFLGSIISNLLLIIPIFKGFQTQTAPWALIGLHLVFACLVSIPQGIFVEMTNDLFEHENRSLGTSITHILPAAFIAGPLQFVLTWVVHQTGWLMFPAFCIILSGLIALPATLKLKESSTTY